MSVAPITKVELGLNQNPLAGSVTWTEINADDVLAVSLSEGRQSVTDTETTSATCALQLDNSAREYDPNESGSAYFGSADESALRPGVPIRVSAKVQEEAMYVANPDSSTVRYLVAGATMSAADLHPDVVTLTGRITFDIGANYQVAAFSTSGVLQLRLYNDGDIYMLVRKADQSFATVRSSVGVGTSLNGSTLWLQGEYNMATGAMVYRYSTSMMTDRNLVDWVELSTEAGDAGTTLDPRIDEGSLITGSSSSATKLFYSSAELDDFVFATFDPLHQGAAVGDEDFGGANSVNAASIAAETHTVEQVVFRGMVNSDGFQQVELASPASYRARVMCLDPLGYLAQLNLSTGLFGSVWAKVCEEYDATGGTNINSRIWRTLLGNPGDKLHGESGWVPYGPDFGALSWWDGSQASTDDSLAEAIRPGLDGSRDLSVNTFFGESHILYTTSGFSRTYGLGIKLDALPSDENGVRITGPTDDTKFGLRVGVDGRLQGSMNGGTDVMEGPILEVGKAYFVSMSWDDVAGETHLYVDGTLVASDTSVSSVSLSSVTIRSNDGTFKVRVSDEIVNLFSALTAAQHLALANAWHGLGGIRTDDFVEAVCQPLDVLAFTSASEGRTVMAPRADDQLNYTTLLAAAERTERGRLHYSAEDEGLRFILRKDLLADTGRQSVSQLTLTDDPDDPEGLRFAAPELVAVPRLVQVTSTGPDGSFTLGQLAVTLGGDGAASASVATDSHVPADPLAMAMATAGDRVTAKQAVSTMTIQPGTFSEAVRLLGAKLFDRVTLRFQPTGSGDVITKEYLLEGRSYLMGSGTTAWSAVLFLSEATDLSEATTWRWGVASYVIGVDGLDDLKWARS